MPKKTTKKTKRKSPRKKAPRRDSTAGRVAKIRAVAGAEPIEPPPHVTLREPGEPEGNVYGDRVYWDEIVASRARENWTNPDLVKAAQLARCLADIERVQRAVDDEGDTIVNTRGTRIVNPLHSLLETLTRRSLGLSRALHVHAEATTGQARKEKAPKKAQEKAEKAVKVANKDEDGLIAPPESLH